MSQTLENLLSSLRSDALAATRAKMVGDVAVAFVFDVVVPALKMPSLTKGGVGDGLFSQRDFDLVMTDGSIASHCTKPS